jgi:DNA gyrase subunit A
MTLPKDDELIEAGMCDGTCDIMLATRKGMAVRFPETKVRDMGRAAYGVRGIDLKDGDYVVGMVVVRREAALLTVTENGYGKRSEISDYRVTNRGGKGVINIRIAEKNGEVVAIKEVVDGDELLLITQRGIMNRLAISSIRTIGRATQGVRLMSLAAGDKVIDVARVPATEKVTNGLPSETPKTDEGPAFEEPELEEGGDVGGDEGAGNGDGKEASGQ